jgi:hypothetical protein
LLGLLVGLIAFVLTGRVVSERAPSHELLKLTQDLPVGTVLTPGHLTTVAVTLDDQTVAGYLTRGELDRVIGRPLQDRAYRDMLLRREHLAAASPLAANQVAASIAVRPEHAIAGNLKIGDQVLVAQARPDRTEIVLERARIIDVSNRSGLIVSLALTQSQLLQLLTARARGELQLVLLPPEGETRTSETP